MEHYSVEQIFEKHRLPSQNKPASYCEVCEENEEKTSFEKEFTTKKKNEQPGAEGHRNLRRSKCCTSEFHQTNGIR